MSKREALRSRAVASFQRDVLMDKYTIYQHGEFVSKHLTTFHHKYPNVPEGLTHMPDSSTHYVFV